MLMWDEADHNITSLRSLTLYTDGVQLFAKSHGSCFFFSFYYSEEDARLTLYGQKKPSTCTRLGGRRRKKKDPNVELFF